MERILRTLNYHHLLYFWVVAREGSVSRACKKLGVAQPTISAQLRSLEQALKTKLFSRAGRGLALTESGHLTLRYANEIFSLGRELTDTLRGRAIGRLSRFTVGVVDSMAKLIAYRLLEPAFRLPEAFSIAARENSQQYLLGELVAHNLDLVLAESPLSPESHIKAFNHFLGECSVTVFGVPSLVKPRKQNFPQSLDAAPILLPSENTLLRRALERYFVDNNISPHRVGEFDDSASAKVFGMAGIGLFVAPTVIAEEVKRQYQVEVLGELESVRERYYAISMERRIRHPAVAAISNAARNKLFANEAEKVEKAEKPEKADKADKAKSQE